MSALTFPPAQGAPGAAGSAANIFGAPVTRTLSLATAYQATTPAKPALLTIIMDLAAGISIGTVSNTVELIIGSTNAVAGGTGTLADSWRNDLTVTLISITINSRQTLRCNLPANWYFAVRRTVGTGMTVAAAFDQAVG
jgi:hypothetical protein